MRVPFVIPNLFPLLSMINLGFILLQFLNETITSLVLFERSELTRLGLSLETVFGSVVFLSLSKFLSFVIAKQSGLRAEAGGQNVSFCP